MNLIIKEEVWKVIPNYPNYEVSNYGRVRSWTNWKKGELMSAQQQGRGAYYQVRLSHKKHSTSINIHTLVMSAFVGERQKGMEVRHLDGNPANNHLDNLAYGTAKENGQDRIKHKTTASGIKNWNSKLIPADIYLVRLLDSFGWGKIAIAKVVGVSRGNIYKILNGTAWKHV